MWRSVFTLGSYKKLLKFKRWTYVVRNHSVRYRRKREAALEKNRKNSSSLWESEQQQTDRSAETARQREPTLQRRRIYIISVKKSQHNNGRPGCGSSGWEIDAITSPDRLSQQLDGGVQEKQKELGVLPGQLASLSQLNLATDLSCESDARISQRRDQHCI